jgi:predicted amidophosphoribosyltransferase
MAAHGHKEVTSNTPYQRHRKWGEEEQESINNVRAINGLPPFQKHRNLCLKCGKYFEEENKFIRRCKKCKKNLKEKEDGYATDVY